MKNQDFIEFLELVKPPGNGNSFINIKYIKPTINPKAIANSPNFHTSDEISHVKSPEYLKTHIKKYDYKKTIHNFKNKCIKEGSIPIAVLPWKLFKSSNIIVTKDPLYLDNHMDKIDETIDIIKFISTGKTKLEKIELFDNLYPNSDIIKEYNLISKNARDFI
jgi:hypothetical protein